MNPPLPPAGDERYFLLWRRSGQQRSDVMWLFFPPCVTSTCTLTFNNCVSSVSPPVCGSVRQNQTGRRLQRDGGGGGGGGSSGFRSWPPSCGGRQRFITLQTHQLSKKHNSWGRGESFPLHRTSIHPKNNIWTILQALDQRTLSSDVAQLNPRQTYLPWRRRFVRFKGTFLDIQRGWNVNLWCRTELSRVRFRRVGSTNTSVSS